MSKAPSYQTPPREDGSVRATRAVRTGLWRLRVVVLGFLTVLMATSTVVGVVELGSGKSDKGVGALVGAVVMMLGVTVAAGWYFWRALRPKGRPH